MAASLAPSPMNTARPGGGMTTLAVPDELPARSKTTSPTFRRRPNNMPPMKEREKSNPTLEELVKANERLLNLEDLLINLRKEYDAEKMKNRKLKASLETMTTDLTEQRRLNKDLTARQTHLSDAERHAVDKGERASTELRARQALEKRLRELKAESDIEKRNNETRYNTLKAHTEKVEKQKEMVTLQFLSIKNSLVSRELEFAEAEERHGLEKVTWEREILRMEDKLASENAIKGLIYEVNLERHAGFASNKAGERPSTPIETAMAVSRWMTEQGPDRGSRMTTIERAFKRIQALMGTRDIDSAIQMFAGAETKNDLLDRLEKLTEENQSLRSELSRFQKELDVNTRTSESHTYKKTLRLESKMRTLQQQSDSLTGEVSRLKRIMAEIKHAVLTLSHESKAFDSTVAFMKEGVTDENVLKFLGAIEERIVVLMSRPQRLPGQVISSHYGPPIREHRESRSAAGRAAFSNFRNLLDSMASSSDEEEEPEKTGEESDDGEIQRNAQGLGQYDAPPPVLTRNAMVKQSKKKIKSAMTETPSVQLAKTTPAKRNRPASPGKSGNPPPARRSLNKDTSKRSLDGSGMSKPQGSDSMPVPVETPTLTSITGT